jgi:hypothetical protein
VGEGLAPSLPGIANAAPEAIGALFDVNSGTDDPGPIVSSEPYTSFK